MADGALSERWGAEASRRERPLQDRVEDRLTERAATFEAGEFRSVLFEQAVGELSPREAVAFSQRMIIERRVLLLEGGLMTTRTVRDREEAIEQRFGALAAMSGREVGERARAAASDRIAERIGTRLSDEQERALRLITGPERAAVVIGPRARGRAS